MIAAGTQESTRGNRQVKEAIRLTLRIETLVRNLLAETTTAFLDRTHVPVPGSEPTFKQPCTKLGAELWNEGERSVLSHRDDDIVSTRTPVF